MSERSSLLRNPTRQEVLDHLRLIHSESAKRARQLSTLYQEIHAWKQLSSELSAHNEALAERILKLEDEMDEEEDLQDDLEAEKEDLAEDILDAKKELGLLIDDIRCMRNDLEGKNRIRVHEELGTIRKRAIETERKEAADLEDTLARVDAMTVDLIGGPSSSSTTGTGSGQSPSRKAPPLGTAQRKDSRRPSAQTKPVGVAGGAGGAQRSSHRDPVPRSLNSSAAPGTRGPASTQTRRSETGVGAKTSSQDPHVPRARIDLSSTGSYAKR
jgi:hypothetical protein